MDHEMKLEVEAFIEALNTGREELVKAEELEEFALTPGYSSCNGHGNSSCSCGATDLE
jgi:hypothetical protein